MQDEERSKQGDPGQAAHPSPKALKRVRKVFVRVPPDPTDDEIDALADLMIDELFEGEH